MEERLIFHVDMNAFFAAVEQRFDPSLRGRPIVICGNAKTRTVVAACSYEAKAYGIKNGMSVAEAKRLCPRVLLVGGNPEKYVDIAQHLFAILATFTPQVEVFSIDEAFLDVTGTAGFAGPEPEDLARRIKQQIRTRYGLTCSIGIGPNKLIAKLASDLKKPDGLVRVRAAEVPALLDGLPVESLCGVGPHLQTYLNELGIVTCAELGRAPEDLLVARFGVIGRCLRRMGQGQDESPVAMVGAEGVVKSMGHTYTLPRDTDDGEALRGTLLRLAEQVARRLRADGYQGRTVALTVRYTDFATFVRHATLPYPTDSGLQLFRAAWRVFEAACEPLRQRVRLLGVGASNLIRHERQLSWLEAERQLERLDRCADRLNDRFGECTVVRASAALPLVPKSHGFLLGKGSDPERGLTPSGNRRGLVLR